VRRVWAAVAATWALLAIVAVLAWSHPPVQGPPGGTGVVVIKGKSRLGHVVVLPSSVATHTTTHTSPPPGG
jgi:hypothetical protein